MKKAEDFRSIARDTLAGKWKNAVLVGLVASLLGAVDGAGLDLNIDNPVLSHPINEMA